MPSTNNQPDQLSINKQKHFKKYRTLAIIALCIGVIISLLLYNRDYLILYYLNVKYNNHKLNDKLYAKKRMMDDTAKSTSHTITLYRKIRPLNNDDIDAMNLSLSEKALIKSNLNTSDKPAINSCDWSISADSLRKYKMAYIGNYMGAEILNNKFKKVYYPMIYFAVRANKKALIKNPSSLNDLPQGYTYDDGPFYVRLFEVVN